jgi:PadR family transcriptional regulator AphA
MLDFALLGFLSYSPMTGYELKQNMDGSTSHFWNAKLSQIYTTLKSLEKRGWVRSSVQVQEERPDKRVYTITAEGKSSLQEWLAEPLTELAPHKNALLLKLFFAAQTDKETVVALLHLQKNLHQRQADFYRIKTRDLIQGILQRNPALEKDGIFWEAARRFGELYEETYVKWLDETINSLEENL